MDDDGDVRWRFVVASLSTLLKLRLHLTAVGAAATDASVPLLSVRQQKQVSTLLQMVTALGLLPNLMPGVGLALERRSQFVRCLQGSKVEHGSTTTVEQV